MSLAFLVGIFDCRAEFYLDSFCLAKISVTVFSQAKKALANQLVYDLSR